MSAPSSTPHPFAEHGSLWWKTSVSRPISSWAPFTCASCSSLISSLPPNLNPNYRRAYYLLCSLSGSPPKEICRDCYYFLFDRCDRPGCTRILGEACDSLPVIFYQSDAGPEARHKAYCAKDCVEPLCDGGEEDEEDEEEEEEEVRGPPSKCGRRTMEGAKCPN